MYSASGGGRVVPRAGTELSWTGWRKGEGGGIVPRNHSPDYAWKVQTRPDRLVRNACAGAVDGRAVLGLWDRLRRRSGRPSRRWAASTQGKKYIEPPPDGEGSMYEAVDQSTYAMSMSAMSWFSRFTTMLSGLRVVSQMSSSVWLRLPSMCGTNGGTYTKSPSDM